MILKKTIFILIIVLLTVAGSVVVQTLILPCKKVVYINNNNLFENFNGTKVLRNKLQFSRESHQHKIDSVSLIPEYTLADIQILNTDYQKNEQLIINEYSSEIWKSLNKYAEEYALEHNIDIMLGANGSGVLMYAKTDLEITSLLIEYSNKKYEGEN